MDSQSRNLLIPRGKVFFAKFLAGTQNPGPYRELGNCPEVSLNRESETLPHYSSQGGMRTLDEDINIESALTGNIVTDDFRAENVAYFFMSSAISVAQTLVTGKAVSITGGKAGDMYVLGATAANPSGDRKVNTFATTVPAPASFVAGTHYLLDADLGILELLVDVPTITGTYNVAASTRTQISTGDTAVEGELRFVSFNAFGAQADTVIPRARLSPNGDLNLVLDPESTEWATLSLSITALKKNNLPLAIRDGRAT